jgi:hypothetical protein
MLLCRLPQGPSQFSFCNYSFVYDPASKARIMQLENACAQYEEFQSSVLQVGGVWGVQGGVGQSSVLQVGEVWVVQGGVGQSSALPVGELWVVQGGVCESNVLPVGGAWVVQGEVVVSLECGVVE